MKLVANSIMQNQLMQDYNAFLQNPDQFLSERDIQFTPADMNNPKALFEKATGQKVPDEYANNPLGYLQTLIGQNNDSLINMFQMLIRRK